MEELIQQILSLDKKTKEFTNRAERELEESKAEIQNMLNNFELKSHEEAKKRAIEMYEKVYSEAMAKVESISEENQKRLKDVESIYQENKEELITKAIKLLEL